MNDIELARSLGLDPYTATGADLDRAIYEREKPPRKVKDEDEREPPTRHRVGVDCDHCCYDCCNCEED